MSEQQFISPSSVTFTPASGAVTIGHVSRLVYRDNAASVCFAGDADSYPTAVSEVSGEAPEVQVSCLVPAILDAVPAGTHGSLSWVLNDAFNGAMPGGGAVRYTIANAVFLRKPVNAPHYVYADTDFLFRAVSSDGMCPLTSAAV